MGRKFAVPKDEYVLPKRETSVSNDRIQDIDINKITMDKENADIYGNETEDSIRALADDILENGFKGAIMAYPIEDGMYRIESGHRRFLASKYIGLSSIPVIITTTPVTDAERRIRFISMNLHSRESLKPTVMTKVIMTLIDSNREDRQVKGLSSDMASLLEVVSGQMELSTKSLEKYKQFSKLDSELQNLGDEGISWSALTQASTLSLEQQQKIASTIWTEVERVGVDNVSRQWVIELIKKSKEIMSGVEDIKPRKIAKKRNGGKIISRYAKQLDLFEATTIVFKPEDKENILKDLIKIKTFAESKIQELS